MKVEIKNNSLGVCIEIGEASFYPNLVESSILLPKLRQIPRDAVNAKEAIRLIGSIILNRLVVETVYWE